MSDRRSFLKACIAGGAGMIFVPKLAERFRYRPGGIIEPRWVYTSSDTQVATVDPWGEVTCHRSGSVVISAIKGPDLTYTTSMYVDTKVGIDRGAWWPTPVKGFWSRHAECPELRLRKPDGSAAHTMTYLSEMLFKVPTHGIGKISW